MRDQFGGRPADFAALTDRLEIGGLEDCAVGRAQGGAAEALASTAYYDESSEVGASVPLEVFPSPERFSDEARVRFWIRPAPPHRLGRHRGCFILSNPPWPSEGDRCQADDMSSPFTRRSGAWARGPGLGPAACHRTTAPGQTPNAPRRCHRSKPRSRLAKGRYVPIEATESPAFALRCVRPRVSLRTAFHTRIWKALRDLNPILCRTLTIPVPISLTRYAKSGALNASVYR